MPRTKTTPKKATPEPGRIRRRYRFKAGTVARREAFDLQVRDHSLQIPKVAFQRLVKEVMKKTVGTYRIQSKALACMQESTEMHVVDLLVDGVSFAQHARRVTLKKCDIELAQRIGARD